MTLFGKSAGRIFLVGVLALAATCQGGRATAVVERVDIALNLLVDGSVEVRELWILRANEASSQFERVIRRNHADAIFDLSATIDGRVATEGRGQGQVRVQTGRPTRVRFTFAPTSAPTRTLTLQYRASAIVSISGNRGHVSWEALPARRRFDVLAARVDLSLPERTVQYGPAGVAQAGWKVSETPRGISAVREHPPRDEPATIVADISTTTMALSEPQWQFNEARGRELMPAFASGAIFILVIGAGILWIVRFQYPSPVPATDVMRGAQPTASPVLQAALVHRTALHAAPGAIAVLVDLGLRRRLELREDADHRVVITPESSRSDMLSHEQVVLDELWMHRSQAQPMRAVKDALRRRDRAFGEAVTQDLVSAGLADRDRVGVRTGLRAAGLAVLLFAVVCFVVVGLLLGKYGAWPMAMPASILIVGIALMAAGEMFPVLTPEGARQAQIVKARAPELRGGKGAPRDLPLAIAAGYAAHWRTLPIDDDALANAFEWLTPAAGESRSALLSRLLKPTAA